MKSRAAISLVELLAVLSGCSIVLTLTAMLLHQTMRTQSDTRDFFSTERNQLRLARQFREDVHGATAAANGKDVDQAGTLVRLSFPEGRAVEYRHEAGTVVRIQRERGKPSAREEYLLGESLEADVQELESPTRLSLSIASPPIEPLSTNPAKVRERPIRFQVEAVLSRDLRFAATPAGEEPR